ncbi:hypothetical protein SKAU_G00062530 [Synaphobranchus kaupii]|uniref:Uncharacterized protein n=1 Tax=Synaphobranchus kaupii TaxID=118154 RepID=A0A9Q1G5Z5_SYNKA|nr:hypothetical protein SKAU_G00062530 [Synaphobranchus kaupii]
MHPGPAPQVTKAPSPQPENAGREKNSLMLHLLSGLIALRSRAGSQVMLKDLPGQGIQARPVYVTVGTSATNPALQTSFFKQDVIIMTVQRESYSEELTMLTDGMPIPNSPLIKLSPILDKSMIRIGGRLQHSQLDSNEKNPLILPDKVISLHCWYATFMSRLNIKVATSLRFHQSSRTVDHRR